MKTKESVVRARIEPELKAEAEAILKKMGMTTAEAIRLFMNQIRLNHGFPYPLRIPNKVTEEAIEETGDYKSLSSYDGHRELRKEIGV